jgi:imidazolonepropionase-like amidohydrolase
VVKIMMSGGNMTPGSAPHESQYSPADLRIVVDEAHRLGLPVVAHAHGTPAIAKRMQAVHEAFGNLYKPGATIVLGTDAGIAPVKPHDVLPYCVSQLTAAGPSPSEALRAATGLAARACGVSDRKGRIEVGADADLLAVTGNPLDDLDRLLDVRAVFRAGARVR